jgi:hypothetical protein
MANGWQRRVVSLAPVMGPALATAESIRLRFVAEETTE